ncbi:hypothetical protein GOODEAATRI_010022 [Goodea atripinnis]|uniref:Uncharacterized protein n=1 Tax=Goodea atripinnis TaxID=208336 RepID=A0ABV0MGJ7_9TELE
MESSPSCSSMVADLPQESFLQRTLERLSSTQSLELTAEEAVPVAVVALQRYLSEPTDGQHHEQQLDSYSYDVTITDGLWRAKCVLHPSLNQLVHRNTLRTGTDISVRQCSFVYNERRLGHGYICIEKLGCSAETSSVLPRINNINSLPILVKHGMERNAVLQSDVPLQVSRKHYLSLWNNDDPEGDMWTSGYASPDPVLDGEILLFSDNTLVSWKPLPLLVKIIHKSRLRSELEKLSNGSACDVIGLVTFVGRIERVKSKVNKGQVPLVAASDLKRELESLQYREHKKLAIQGQITAVRFTKNPKTTEEGREVTDFRFFNNDSPALSWKSSSWSKQREQISEHLHQGGLHPDSLSHRFTFDEKSALLQWSNLQPTRWTSQIAARDALRRVPYPGHYQLTILGKAE